MFVSPVTEIIELCKTKKAEDVSEFVFILFIITSATYWINFTRKLDWIAMVPNFVGKLIFTSYFQVSHSFNRCTWKSHIS